MCVPSSSLARQYPSLFSFKITPKLEDSIRTCSANRDSNDAKLLSSSAPAWRLVAFHDRRILFLLEELNPSELNHLAIELTLHKSCTEVFEHTFCASQRSRKRRGWYPLLYLNVHRTLADESRTSRA